MPVKRFSARLGAEGHTLFFEVPFDVKQEFGKARPAVKVSVNGYSYRSRVSVYGDKYYLPVRSERREAAGVKQGHRPGNRCSGYCCPNGPTSAGALRGPRQKQRRQSAVAEAQLYAQEGVRERHPRGKKTRDSRPSLAKDPADACC
jgi:hypothetical protein